MYIHVYIFCDFRIFEIAAICGINFFCEINRKPHPRTYCSDFAGTIFVDIFVLRNSQNIHPSKITRYTVPSKHEDYEHPSFFVTFYSYVYVYTVCSLMIYTCGGALALLNWVPVLLIKLVHPKPM